MIRNIAMAICVLSLAWQAHAAPPDSFSSVIEPVMPAVVNISTTQKVKQPGVAMFDLDAMPDDPHFRQFRELFRQFNDQFGQGMSREVTSLGSGFVIDEAGYVVTNNHVIANADDITVIFSDDTRLPATLIGTDPKTDLALLKVKSARKLTAVKFGDSETLKVGDWVIAVGNPFGFGGSVSAGIVSARGRNIHAGPFDDFIQTDAAINRGNSGGPLFNARGEVVGVNAAIFSPTGASVGIGFAVPASLAKPIIDQLRENGKVSRAWLGVKIQDVTEEMADALGMKEPRGALVLDVDGPATNSGIEPGDVIVSFDGRDIKQNTTLPRLVADTKIGKKVEVVVLRQGKEHSYSVRLGQLPGEQEQARTTKKDNTESRDATRLRTRDTVLGMALVAITPDVRMQTNLPASVRGLLVTDMDLNSVAAGRGVKPGDVIVEANQQPVATVAALKEQIEATKRDRRGHVLLKIQRRDVTQFVAVPTRER